MQRCSVLLRQKPDRIQLQAACRVVDPDQKFLPLHQVMKATIIQHPQWTKTFSSRLLAVTKPYPRRSLKNFTTAHLAILGLAGCRRCRRERPFDRQQILDHPVMLIGAERYGHDINGQEPHEAEPFQCRPVKKYFLVTDAHELVSLAFILTVQLAFTDLYVTVCFLLPASCFLIPASCFLIPASCFLLHFHHPARRHTMGRNGTKLLVTRSIEAG